MANGDAMKKSAKMLFGGVVVLSLMIATLYIISFGNPFAATDPRKIGFTSQSFDFRHYSNESLQDTLSLLFPLGTSMKKVDEFLVVSGGARKVKIDFIPSDLGKKSIKVPNAYNYTYKDKYTWAREILTLSIYHFNGWSVRVEFDEKDQLKAFWLKSW